MKKIVVFILMGLSLMAKGMEVNLSEDTLNSFMSAVGSYSGTGKLKLDFMKIPYEWEISNAYLDLVEGGAKFYSDFSIDVKGTVTEGKLEGLADITYDADKQELNISVKTLNLSGLEGFNLGEIYKPEFSVPLSLIDKSALKIKKGDEVIVLKANVTDEKVSVTEDEIKVEGNIEFERN